MALVTKDLDSLIEQSLTAIGDMQQPKVKEALWQAQIDLCYK